MNPAASEILHRAPASAPSLRHRLEYGLVMALAWCTRFLPQRVVLGSGSLVGLAFYILDRRHRRVSIANLERAFPSKSPAECRAIARRVFVHFGRLLMEVLRFTWLPPERIRAMIEFEGSEWVFSALEQGKGALLLTGHFGFWEIHGIAHAIAHPPIGVVARPLDNPLLNGLVERTRTRLGNTVIYRRGGLRRILRALASNTTVAVLIDQHIQTADAVNVEFFGRPVSTTTAVAALALRTGAPVIPCFALPLPDGRYRCVYEHPVAPPASDSPDPLREFTQRCTDVLEMYVRRYPELWLWMHRRWREDDRIEPERGMFPAGADDFGDADATSDE